LLQKTKYINKVIQGEFEYPLVDIAKNIPEKDISNLYYKENNEIKKNNQRPYLSGKELDEIPFISEFFKKQLDIYKYRTISEPYPFMDIMTGRGCKWGLCTYCLWVHTYIKGSVYNVRSIENVIEEFKYIEKDLPHVRSVMIQDDTFTDERIMEFCEAKIKAGIKIKWSCYARANLTYESLAMMKKANCLNLHVGYESASKEVLKNIKKGLSRETMEKFTHNAKKARLHIHGDFALGFPGETVESAKETIKWAQKLNPHTAQFQLMIPFPGTPFYALLKHNGWLTEKGEPDYPDYSNEQIRCLAKQAYRSFYISPQYLYKAIRDPYYYVFLRLKAIFRAIPAMFWRRW
ncbi:MAG: radical SAM protein, partial [Candidatus Eremiobacterota bacterium]